MYVRLLITLFLFSNLAWSGENCPPDNPQGIAENTLCIKHYLPIINPKNVDYGRGHLSHHGYTVRPERPGVGFIFRDKLLPKGEFYTNVSVGDESGGIRVETNTGRQFQNLNDVSEQ